MVLRSYPPTCVPAQPFGKLPYVLRAGAHPAISLFQIRGGKPVHVVGQDSCRMSPARSSPLSDLVWD